MLSGRLLWLVLGGLGLSISAALFWSGWFAAPVPPERRPGYRPRGQAAEVPRRLVAAGKMSLWWDGLPEEVEDRVHRSPSGSNIHPGDYAGPETCLRCHPRQHSAWSEHPHRWMNAHADATTVLGDFSATAQLDYRGGRAQFRRQGDACFMHLERDGTTRSYRITQTIGRRFYQYYVGRLVEGPEPAGHVFRERDHVLPFGYWLPAREWVPVVHIGPELPDDQRPDPFAPVASGPHFADYAASCNYCHTTFPLGDLLARRPHQIGRHSPFSLHWSIRPYLDEVRPGSTAGMLKLLDRPGVESPLARWEAPKYAVTLGISCEACHLGARAHAEDAAHRMPSFFPASPHLGVESGGLRPDSGRTQANVNWACGRCHTGSRPTFAAGMSTWNSVEYDDAMRGSCYSKLRCIDCHDPHRAIGPRWSATPQADDSVCLKCHERYRPEEARQAHTHHLPGSPGSRCMDCHMPKLNEGIHDVVRTHMIYSPTRADMIEAGHPNACNLCHTDRPIDWTLGILDRWYGKRYDETKIRQNYPRRKDSVAHNWLLSDNPAVRLVAGNAISQARDRSALPGVIDALDDAYLLNRQFAYKNLQEWLNLSLRDKGYHFTLPTAERKKALEKLRQR